jgi:hypothetical protein
MANILTQIAAVEPGMNFSLPIFKRISRVPEPWAAERHAGGDAGRAERNGAFGVSSSPAL